MPTRTLPSLALAATLFALAVLPGTLRHASAQSISTAQLNGVVRDPSGAAIPNASVTAADPSRGISRTVVADSAGNYLILQLPPGTYSVTATAPNFSKLIQNNVILTVGDQANLPLTLPIAGGSDTVTVNANADIIETERSSQATTVGQVQIQNLPTNGRNYINFTLTNSQIARDAAPSVGAIPTSGLNFGGVRARSNSINIDGADAGDYISGGTRATVSQDAVQEFQIITNGFDAEYGRASGGVVNIVTKSGTNADSRLRLRLPPQSLHPGHQPLLHRRPARLHPRPGRLHRRRSHRPQQDLLLLRRRDSPAVQESGFSVIGSNNFGFSNIDV